MSDEIILRLNSLSKTLNNKNQDVFNDNNGIIEKHKIEKIIKCQA